MIAVCCKLLSDYNIARSWLTWRLEENQSLAEKVIPSWAHEYTGCSIYSMVEERRAGDHKTARRGSRRAGAWTGRPARGRRSLYRAGRGNRGERPSSAVTSVVWRRSLVVVRPGVYCAVLAVLLSGDLELQQGLRVSDEKC